MAFYETIKVKYKKIIDISLPLEGFMKMAQVVEVERRIKRSNGLPLRAVLLEV